MSVRKKNEIVVCGDTALIHLADGVTTSIDASDAEACRNLYWRLVQGRARHQPTTVAARKVSAYIFLHRLIMNAPKGQEVDHINGNPLDNRRCNLRLCSHSENMRNRGADRTTTTGYKGVKKDRKTGRHISRIQLHGKQIHLGVFDDAESAARAYDAAAVPLHGEFARLNFPEA